jgi:peptide-methionine (S)-S-oxide reductase
MWTFTKKLDLPTADQALPGRGEPMRVPDRHEVLGTPLTGPWAPGLEVAYFALGCFWGAEEIYWQLPGVHSTAVGYQGGITPNPTYEEACSGRTGHTEAVQVVYDPSVISYEQLLTVFWESHDSTSGMRQGNDIGTQYRSAVYTTSDDQLAAAKASREVYGGVLKPLGYDPITTEILPAGPFYYAEAYHQQYLHKNPHGYRCHSETGVPYPS